MSIPTGLIDVVKNKRVTLFIGSGLSVAAGLPTGSGLAKALADKMNHDARGSRSEQIRTESLPDVAHRFEQRYDRVRLANELELRLGSTDIGDIGRAHYHVANLIKHGFVDTVITTNYDTLIEDACKLLGVKLKVIVHKSQLHYVGEDGPVLLKIHGDFHYPELLVIARTDYERFASDPERQPILRHYEALLQSRPFLYIGYSVEDIDLLQSLASISRHLDVKSRPRSYVALKGHEDADYQMRRLQELQLDPFPIHNGAEFLGDLFAALEVKLSVAHLVFAYPVWNEHPQVQYGGIETYVDIIRKHSRHSHETLRVWPQEEAPARFSQLTTLDLNKQPRWLSYPSSYFYFKFATCAAMQELLRLRKSARIPDVIHVHFLAFSKECQKLGFPSICTSHSLLSKDLAFTRGMFDRCADPSSIHEISEVSIAEKEACQQGAPIITLSRAHAEELSLLGADNVLTLAPPFDPALYGNNLTPAEARAQVREDEIFNITFVGRPDRRKGLEILIGACTLLQARGHKFQLRLVGSHFEHDREEHRLGFCFNRFSIAMREFVERGGFLRFDTPGNYVPSVAKCYAVSDIIVVPSLYEPLGYVVLEAMAAGRPVVGSRTGGIRELIRDQETGLLFEPGNAEDLAEKLELLLRDPELVQRLSRDAKKHVQEKYVVNDSVAELDRMYEMTAFGGAQQGERTDEMFTRHESIYQKRLNDLSGCNTVYQAAELGCHIYKEIVEAREQATGLAAQKIDFVLFTTVATRVHSALREKGKNIIPIDKLAELMTSLTLAFLNRDNLEGEQIDLSAARTLETLRGLAPDWPANAIGNR